MKTSRIQRCVLSLVVAVALGAATKASAQQVQCRSNNQKVTAVSLPGNHNIYTQFQLDTPNLELLLKAKVTVGGTAPSCVVAQLSAQSRITDNYVVYQVRVDGVPMEGQLGGWAGVPDPVVIATIDDADEQASDPYRMVSHSFFATVPPGNHVVEVMAAAGSGVAPGLEPQVYSPVLTVHYQ